VNEIEKELIGMKRDPRKADEMVLEGWRCCSVAIAVEGGDECLVSAILTSCQWDC
jgi:hypothetical protein